MNYISVSLQGSRFAALPFFDPRSRYYHAWFGVYAVLGEPLPFGFRGGRPVPDALTPLVLADELYWQEVITGSSLCQPTFTFLSSPERVTFPHLAPDTFLFYARIASRSVLGSKDTQVQKAQRYFPLPLERVWSDVVAAHHPIEHQGFGIVWVERASGTTFCAYGTSACFVDVRGETHNYSRFVEPELMALVANLRLRAIRGHR